MRTSTRAHAVRVEHIMTTPVHTVLRETLTVEIARLLTQHRISAMPVVDAGGAPIGIVSEHDLIARDGTTAEDIMSRGLVSVTGDTHIEDVRHLLVDRRIRRVPVMAGGQIVGIVSRSDLVALIALEWVCDVCGTQARDQQPPTSCPTCAAAGTRFSQQQQLPGT